MQLFETASLALFLASYVFSALFAFFAPEKYRDTEVLFYRTGQLSWSEWIVFIPPVLSLVTLVFHFLWESPRVAELLLYGQVALFNAALPFHFQKSFQSKMVRTLGKKTVPDYKRSGQRKLLIAVIMLALPLFVHV